MKVEEYQTVFQLVSVIEGQIPRSERPDDNDTCQKKRSSGCTSGIDVLVAALPPGSMTGAPKKRSCELLMQLEDEPRGIYSGVLGYLDLGGGGDFSVVIRTAVKRRGEVVHKLSKSATSRAPLPHQVWRVGAGGAVTIQSTEIGEFEEMETKLDSVLQAFNAG
jgi:para-aminobenzoate synthetase